MAAGLALHDLRTRRDSPDVFCGAASRDQGRILLDFARDFVETGPLADRIRVQRNILTCERTRGVLSVISADGALQHGKSISGWYGDEYHAFSVPKARELHVAMITALFKRYNSAALMPTTAGWNKATLLGEMWDGAMRGKIDEREDGYLLVSRDEENGALFWWRQVPIDADIEDPEVLRRANPASWIDVGELLKILHSDSSGIGELEFRRLHCNQWTESRAAWISLERWLSCQDAGVTVDADPKQLVIPEDEEVFLAVDASYSHDTTAVAWAYRLEDGRIAVGGRVWAARSDAPAHEFERGGVIRMQPVKDYIRAFCDAHNVREIAFDPAYFREAAEDLDDGGLPMLRMDQKTTAMRDAEQNFYDLVIEGGLAHGGDDVLRRHVASVIASRRPNGAWRIRPLDQVGAIDGVVAMIMAAARAARSRNRSPMIAFV
jgi:phage terminase large subunit-like protein